VDVELFAQAVMAGVSIGAIYALVGLGYNVVFAATRVFNLAQGQVLMLGVMFTWQFRQEWGWPTLLAVAAAVLLAGAANVVVERVAVAPLVRRGHAAAGHAPGGLATLITTLGASIIILNLAVEYWDDTQPFTRYFPGVGYHLGDVTITRQQLLMIGAAVVICCGYQAFTARTRWGTALAAMSEDPEAAALRGVPVERGRILAFFVAGIISGLGGAAIGPIAFANPALGFEFGLKGFVAIAIGGFGSITGALVGGMVLGLTESMTATYWDDKYRVYVGLALVLVVLMVRPRGLLGKLNVREV
jgi:branched-chain amino acid transport system permease protein